MTRDAKILLVDDHPIVRDGCLRLLADAGYTRLLEAADGETALAIHAREHPDVVVLDLNLRGGGPDGIAVTRSLLAKDPQAKTLIFSMNDDPLFAARALKIGARGYITKNDAPATLISAVERVLAGEIYLGHAMARELALMNLGGRPDPLAGLTPREREILGHLGRGMTLGAIAETLGISYKTVANASTLIKDKLGVESTRALIRVAIDHEGNM